MLYDVVRRRRRSSSSLHGFLLLCIRVVLFSINMGLRLTALRAAGAPLKEAYRNHLFFE